jgi:CheY-like chemotaxis protein
VVGLAEPDLASLVGNLVGNALEVSGGKAPVTVSLRREARYVAMSVADRGPGLPEGDLFAPFFSTKAGGTGLGLWLVRRLVQAAGGEVAATNRQGGGAVFRVTLPVVDRDALQGRRVLLVEDDAALSAALTAALAGCGVQVCAHGAVAGALADEAAGDYDLAVLDFYLPDGDATAVAGALPADLPVLLMSGAGQAAGAAGRLPQRRVRFLGKPFALDDFLDLASLLVVKV